MNFEWNATIVLSAIAALSIPFAIRFVWRKYLSPSVKANRGNALNAQNGEISGQGAVGIANSGDGAQFLFNLTPSSRSKYGETEKREAKEGIRTAFIGFFWGYFGNKDHKGQINNPLNLNEMNPRTFKKDRESTIRMNLENGRTQFEKRLRRHAPFLEDSEAEGDLDDLRQKLSSIRDPFDVTEQLRDETLQKVDAILNRK